MLNDWLERANRSRAWLAQQVGTSEVTISRLINRKQSASLGLAVKLEDVTGIPAREFLLPGHEERAA